mmetsp:Transcript_64945/g.141557  ORF Transcript_64945/g.141557 Transcript_64945/m.141557 type:complete len:317 (+) Transcript_64945:908-1858(+)
MRRGPREAPSISSIRREMGAIQRYSMPTMKAPMGEPLCRARSSRSSSSLSTSSQSARVVHMGFSQRMCLPEGMARRRTSMWWKLAVQMTTASTASHFIMSSHCSKTLQGDCSPSSLSAAARSVASGSQIATTVASSASNARLRMCSRPIMPVPIMPKPRGCPKRGRPPVRVWGIRGGPRREARTRRGGRKESLACITRVLSMRSTSPSCHLKATRLSCMNLATALTTSPSTAEPSPNWTAFSPTFLASFQPVKAATTELKKTRLPVRLSLRNAGKAAVVVRQSPLGSHSNAVPCFLITASASCRVATLYVSLHERP